MESDRRDEIDKKLLDATQTLFERNQIAKWKIISPIESLLGKLADKSEIFKRLYVKYYQIFDSKYYRGGLKIIEKEISKFRPGLNGSEKKKLVVDMVYSLHRFGAMYTEYFLFNYPSLNTSGREAFITDKLRYAYCEILNDFQNLEIFDHKEYTYQLFKEFYGRDLVFISDVKDHDKIFSFIQDQTQFILKPAQSSSGRGVEIIDSKGYKSPDKLVDKVLSKCPCILEERVYNHDVIRKIYSEALSTVRIPTIKTQQGTKIFASYIRFGKGGSIVDNVGSGGIIAVIDINTGIIETAAYDKSGKKYLTHPDSNHQIIGFQIPEWDTALDLAKKMSQVVSTNRYVGWDLAYTNKGWIMIEGNGRGEFYGQQFPDKVGKREWLNDLIMM